MIARGRKEGGEAAGRGGNRAAARARGGGQREEEERKGEEGRLTGGAQASAAQGKRKRRGGRWAGAGGRLGRLDRKGVGADFFFFFSFSTSFSNHFSSQIQFKLFQTFLKNFINFLETTQATKNHASQLMMHIHLLSLSLLNYL
jgi:hypothetical protein